MKSKFTAENAGQMNHETSGSVKQEPEVRTAPSQEEIRQRAYELHLEGGCIHGREMDDWLQAERELTDK
jgi:Protein of unknown function (DUF2934)